MPGEPNRWKRRLLTTLIAAMLAVPLIALLGMPKANAATTNQTFLTFYGWWDNTPPGGAIAYPQIHQTAGGTGTFADPITFATYSGELAPGTVVYVPRVGKYFIMEDACQECQADWTGMGPNGGPGLHHIDLWIGGQGGDPMAAINCEGALTDTNPDGTPFLEPVITNPPSNLAFDPTPLFSTSTGHCYDNAQQPATVGTYKNGSNHQCIDDPGNSATPGVKLVTRPCTASAQQQFTFQGAFLIRNNLCADYTTSPISLQKCTAGPKQQWSVNPNGTISDIQTGRKCIGVSGTNVVARRCSGSASQWTFTSTIGAQPDFSVAVSPTSGSVTAGSSVTATVSTAVTAGAAESLGLYSAGFPVGGSGAFCVRQVTAGGSSTLTISTSSSTQPGTYLIAVTGSGSTGTHTVFFTLTVS